MNIHEYQAKELLAKYGVAVPWEIPARTPGEVRAAADKILAGGSAGWSSNRKSTRVDAARARSRTDFKAV